MSQNPKQYCQKTILLDDRRQRTVPIVADLGVSIVVGMDTVGGISRSAEASPLIDDGDRGGAGTLAAGPTRDSIVKADNTLCTCRAPAWVHWKDFSDEDLHPGVACPHLVDEFREGVEDGLSGLVAPHIICPEMHHNHVGFGRRKPRRKLILVCHIGRKNSTMAFILTIIREPTSLRGQRPDEIKFGSQTRVLHALP